jgi:hypothetical protein
MGVVNRGKRRIEYRLCLNLRGHVNAKEVDVIVRSGKKIIERIGLSRSYKHIRVHELDIGKFIPFVNNDIVYTNGCLKHFCKYIKAFPESRF